MDSFEGKDLTGTPPTGSTQRLVDPSARRAELDECRREAATAERLASRTYNVVEYAEHLEVAARWRRRAEAIEKDLEL